MARFGVSAPVLISIILLSAPLIAFAPSGSAADIKTLTGGSSEAALMFEVSGKNITQSVSVPQLALVTSASLDLTGEGLQAQNPVVVEYNFNDSTNNHAWWGASNTQASGLPSTYEGNAFALGEYPNVAKSDDVYKDTANILNQYAYHHYSFLVSATGITSIDVVWEGGGVATSMIGNGGAYVYLYNNQSSQWEQVGNFACGDVWCEQVVSKKFTTNPSNYVDPNNEAHVLAVTRSAGNTNRITTDFVKIVISGIASTYPLDPVLDVGNDGDTQWSYQGAFASKATVSGTGLVDELNALITAAGQGTGDVIIVLAVSTSGPGIVRISNVLIQYTPFTNEAPELVTSIPSDWSLKEDTDAPDLIDLSVYFKDDHDDDLTYTFVNKSAPDLVDATIKPDGKMSITTPKENWWGKVSFIVRATDSMGLFTDSGSFDVTVESVNDPPVFEPVPSRIWFKEAGGVNYTLKAKDVDMELSPNEHIHYSSDSKLVIANAITGEVSVVNVTPVQPAGTVMPLGVNFTASDASGDIDVITVEAMIEDVEFPPILTHIGNRTVLEGARFSLQLEATDRDELDTLTFSAEGDLFDVSADGKIDFVPNQTDVGNHTMVLKVSDGAMEDTETVVFTVVDVNNKPFLKSIPDQTADNRNYIFVFAQGGDQDAEGYGSYYESWRTLTYSDDTPLFDIDPKTGQIEFKATQQQVGLYKITITVTDGEGLFDSRSFVMTVKFINTLPTAAVEMDKSKVKAGQRFTLKAVASDADNDTLTYEWYGGKLGTTLLGKNATLPQKLNTAGKHIYTLKVSDGYGTTNITYTVKVSSQPKGFIPGFDAMVGLLTFVMVTALVMTRKGKR